MICPFSGKLCRECPIFRGRHYFLCYKEDYRGFIKENAATPVKTINRSFRRDTADLLHMQVLDKTKPLDPYEVPQPDIK